MVDIVSDVREIRLSRLDAVPDFNGLGDVEVRRMLAVTQSIDNEHIQILQSRPGLFRNLADVRAVRHAAEAIAQNREPAMQQSQRLDVGSEQRKRIGRGSDQFESRNRPPASSWRERLKGVTVGGSQLLFDDFLAVKRDFFVEHMPELPQVVQPEDVVCVAVGEHRGMHQIDLFADELDPQFRRGVDENIPLRRLHEDTASCSGITRIGRLADRTAAADERHAVTGSGTKNDDFTGCGHNSTDSAGSNLFPADLGLACDHSIFCDEPGTPLNMMDEEFDRRLAAHQIDPRRYAEVERNFHSVLELLQETRYDGLLLTHPENFAWFTAGSHPHFGQQYTFPGAAIFVTSRGRVILTTDSVSPQLFEHELNGLGFQLKERLWTEDLPSLVDEITRGRAVMSDSGFSRTRGMPEQVQRLRLNHSEYTRERLQQLGLDLTSIVERLLHTVTPGMTEREVAVRLNVDLQARGLTPQRVQVYADDAHLQYPGWTAGESTILKRCVLQVIASRDGLSYAVSRSVDFAESEAELRENRERAQHLLATAATALNSCETTLQLWNSIEEAAQALGLDDDWRRSEFAIELGYRCPERVLLPGGETDLREHSHWFWQLRLGGAIVGQTLVRTSGDRAAATLSEDWPRRPVTIGDQTIEIPDVLQASEDA